MAAAMGLGLSVSAAHAATMDLLVTGKVTVVGGGAISPLAVDDIVTFHLAYTTPSPDTDPSPDHGSYTPFSSFESSFNGQTYTSAADTTFDVTNGVSDEIQIRNFGGPGATNGIFSVDVGFSDPTGTALNGDSLPTDLLTLQSMNGMFRFFLVPPLTGGPPLPAIITGQITSIAAVATTPIPAALPLLASALGGLGFMGWRRRRSDQSSGAPSATMETARA
jgi:hypothetical protein